MGRYPETENGLSSGKKYPGATVIDLDSYRSRRQLKELLSKAKPQRPEAGSDGAGGRDAPAEGNWQE